MCAKEFSGERTGNKIKIGRSKTYSSLIFLSFFKKLRMSKSMRYCDQNIQA